MNRLITIVAVKKMLQYRSVKPEALPPAEDVKKVQRKLDGDDKKIIRETKGIKKYKD